MSRGSRWGASFGWMKWCLAILIALRIVFASSGSSIAFLWERPINSKKQLVERERKPVHLALAPPKKILTHLDNHSALPLFLGEGKGSAFSYRS